MTAASSPSPDSPPEPIEPASSGTEPAFQRRVGALRAQLSRTVSIAGMLGLSLVLLGWSLWIRLPSREHLPAVQARGLPAKERLLHGNDWPLSQESVQELSRQLALAGKRLVADRGQVEDWAARVAVLAAAHGWVVRTETSEPVNSSHREMPMLRYPVTLHFEFDPESRKAADPSAFDGLMDVMRDMRTLDTKTEWLRFQLQGGPEGASRGSIGLQLWGRSSTNSHAKTASE